MTDRESDGRVARGAATRKAVLRRAVDVSSLEGLSGLTIGRLAADLEISKSGLFAHFGSKEELQLATIDTAVEIFRAEVLDVGLSVPPGARRVWQLMTAWLDYAERRVFPGGCFFAKTSSEYSDRPGRVHDTLMQYRSAFRGETTRAVRDATQLGELRADTDVDQLVFELSAFVTAALSLATPAAFDQARIAIHSRLARAATSPELLQEKAVSR